MLPPAYTLERGEIVADSGDERARVAVDCGEPLALAVRGSDVLVACGDEMLTYTTGATWHDVKTRTTLLVPSIEVAHGGGMIGLRVTF